MLMGILKYTGIFRVAELFYMNIAQISNGYIRIPPKKCGSIGSVIFNVSKYLSKECHDVTIFDRKYSKEDLDVEYIDGIRIIRVDTLMKKRILYF